MKTIPKEQVIRRIQAENIWWKEPFSIDAEWNKLTRRAYFDLLLPLVKQMSVKRAILLMGPRRVGKTVLIHHVIQALIEGGVAPKRICYVSVDHPLYNDCGLEELLGYFREAAEVDLAEGPAFVFFDEIQYLKKWEVHLKSLVDDLPHVKFVASGSAAAALRLKSSESGAGRFSEFLLPPLTFYEYLELIGQGGTVKGGPPAGFASTPDINALNARFADYLNFGGYPEVVFNEAIRADPARFIKSDIIDKVLLRDLPGLYGIDDIPELNYLFTSLAYNTGQEVSLEELSPNAGVAKNTLKRYIEYLEAAFLIKVVHRVDRNSRRFQRANFFKIYLTNPSIRSALFSPIQESDPVMGHLAETGILSQWFHSDAQLRYARWPQGEVDIVSLEPVRQKPRWCAEVKWSDRASEQPSELKNVVSFCLANGLAGAIVTTKTVSGARDVGGIHVDFVPTSLYCYTVGYNLIRNKPQLPSDPSSSSL